MTALASVPWGSHVTAIRRIEPDRCVRLVEPRRWPGLPTAFICELVDTMNGRVLQKHILTSWLDARAVFVALANGTALP